MDCKHERLRCTNNVFTCLDCGATLTVANPFKDAKTVEMPVIKTETFKPKKKSKKEKDA